MVMWLLGAGVVLLLLELFVIPGFGIFGLGGIIALAVGLFLLLGADAAAAGIVALIFLGLAIALWLLFKFFPKTNIWRKNLSLRFSSTTDRGYVSSDDFSRLIGVEGIAYTILRPAGSAQFKDEFVDVVSEGGFIEKGCRVKVISAEGSRVVVRQII